MKALKNVITSITSCYDRMNEEMVIIVACHMERSCRVSLEMFAQRTLSELWVFLSRVKRTTNLNELLFERLKDFAHLASPQVILEPYQVLFYNYNTLQFCILDEAVIKSYSAKHIIGVEHKLRTAGFASEEKAAAADWIKDYCEKHIKRYEKIKNQLRGSKAKVQPARPKSQVQESDLLNDANLIANLPDIEEGEMN